MTSPRVYTPAVRRIFKKKNFMYSFTFGCAGSSLLCELSLDVASGGHSQVGGHGLLTEVTSHCRARALGHVGSAAAAPRL